MARKAGLNMTFWWREARPRLRELMRAARGLGYSEYFMGIGFLLETSDPSKDMEEMASFNSEALSLGYYAFTDINPDILRGLGASPSNLEPLRRLGFSGVRLDYGFDVDETAAIVREAARLGMWAELNASTTTEEFLAELAKKVPLSNVKASHDFYPLAGSGLTLGQLVEKSLKFKRLGVEVAAFIGSSEMRYRNTVEDLRQWPVGRAAEALFATGVVDRVIIGDPLPPEQDLRDVAEVASRDYVKLLARLYPSACGDVAEALSKAVLGDLRRRSHGIYAYAEMRNSLRPTCEVRRFRGSVVVSVDPRYLEVWVMTSDAPAAKGQSVVGELASDYELRIAELVPEGSRIKIEASCQ